MQMQASQHARAQVWMQSPTRPRPQLTRCVATAPNTPTRDRGCALLSPSPPTRLEHPTAGSVAVQEGQRFKELPEADPDERPQARRGRPWLRKPSRERRAHELGDDVDVLRLGIARAVLRRQSRDCNGANCGQTAPPRYRMCSQMASRSARPTHPLTATTLARRIEANTDGYHRPWRGTLFQLNVSHPPTRSARLT